MIRPLRRVHRVVMLMLAVVLPILVVVAVASRLPAPVQQPWPLEPPR
ncbi:MAG: hypothetical protein AB7U83_22815 [Vicinamibacterales bacterium]